jgi:hypothetical protein
LRFWIGILFIYIIVYLAKMSGPYLPLKSPKLTPEKMLKKFENIFIGSV